jgi:hypothetical protein
VNAYELVAGEGPAVPEIVVTVTAPALGKVDVIVYVCEGE